MKIKKSAIFVEEEVKVKSPTPPFTATTLPTSQTPPPKPPRLRATAERKTQTAATLTTETVAATQNARLQQSVKNQQHEQKPKKNLHFQSPLELRRMQPRSLSTDIKQTEKAQESATKYATILLSAQVGENNNKNAATDAPKRASIRTRTKANTASTTATTHARKSATTTTRTSTKSTSTTAMKSTSADLQETAASTEPSISAKGESAVGTSAATLTATFPALALQLAKNRLAYGCNSLMYACQSGDIAAVLEQLRSKPERLRQRDSHNKNALHYCAAQSAEKRDLVAAASIAIAAPELLESADEDGFTPLHLAVIQGNLAMVNLLLANKADVNAVDNEGHSVVHWATVCGEVEALRSVLSGGASVAIPDINGGSPMHYAAQMCGANYDGKLGQGNSTKLALEILGILLAHPQSSVDIQDKDGRQPLLWAASAGSAKAIIALVKAGARVESADKDGLTALHCAASRGHTECIDTLISLCGAPTDLIDSNGCTALHYAVTLGHADATSRLLDLEADPNRQDRKGRTPAHCGCSKGQFETVKLLKERGANLWLRNAKGDLPVHEAASSGRRELVAWLLEQKPKQVNTTSNDGRSLLHIAAANDCTDMCKMLLDFGGDINAVYRNSKGVVNTPLDCALQRGNRSTAKFLQSNDGLPAGKLRLAARRSNPFQEATTDIVRPLKYAEKEEIYDLKNSKKYVVYLKRSDSDGGGVGADESSCSCTEQTYKREQRFAHKCNKHRRSELRRRTSSCGEPKEVEKTGQVSSDICRSKSNIEIRRSIKRRERHASSSDCEANEDDEDSCENCCYHKRQKQRVLQRRRTTSLRRSRDVVESEQEKTPENSRSEKESSVDKHTRELQTSKEQQNEIAEAHPVSKMSTQSRPHSASKRRTPPTSATKEGTFIRTPPTSAKVKLEAKKSEDTTSTHAVDFTDEDEQITGKAVETLTTQVEIHRSPEEPKAEEPKAEEPANPTEVSPAEMIETITRRASKEVDQLLQMAATVVSSECKNGDEKTENKTGDKEAKEEEEAKLAAENHIKGEEKVETNIEQAATKTETFQTEAPMATVTATAAPLTPAPASNKPTQKSTATPSTQAQPKPHAQNVASTAASTNITSEKPQSASSNASDETKKLREQESRRSFTLLHSDSAEDAEDGQPIRKSSFQILKSDDSIGELEEAHEMKATSEAQVFKIIPDDSQTNVEHEEDEDYEEDDEEGNHSPSHYANYRHGVGSVEITTAPVTALASGELGVYESTNGRRRRLKRRVKSGGTKSRSNWKGSRDTRQAQSLQQQHSTKDQDSGFEPSPRASKTKIPAPRSIYTAYTPRRTLYTTLDGRSCSSRQENRKPGDKGACDMTAVTRSIQRNIRRYYMERKIFQHLLELKSLQIRSNKLNEAVLVKRAVDDYHRSCASLGGETGTRLRRYTFTEYSFKNFELFLYETLKALQKPGTYNFQNINEVYEEAERRLSPDYNAYEKALHCTTKTHRCPHAIHAYTGIPCAAYIPMMNHHTMPKFGFGPYKKTSVGSFYLPKILAKSNSYGGGGGGGAGTLGTTCTGKMALELTHGKSKQLISLPSDKLDSNKRYYVTFTVKETNSTSAAGATGAGVETASTATANKLQEGDNNGTTEKKLQ